MPSLILRPTAPGARPVRHALRKPLVSLGSDASNDIVLPEGPEVAAHHAVVQLVGTQFEILCATRHLEVVHNGRKRKKSVLAHGDVLAVGHCQLEFDLLDAQGPSPAPPAGGGEEDARKMPAMLQGYQRLVELARGLLGNYDVARLLNELMDSVIRLTGADKGFLILSEKDQFVVKVARNMQCEDIADAVSQVSDSVIARVIATRAPLIVSDAINDTHFCSSESVVSLHLSSLMCVPLVDRGSLLGLIYVGNGAVAHLFTPEHLELLTVFAAQASLIVTNALHVNELRLDREMLTRKLEHQRFGAIIGACDAMREVFRKVERVAPTDVSVLITGETGTGKELIAHELHRRSERRQGPFITLNCGAIPESLLESELFGHVKGAFTGAVAQRDGKFQAAHGGTIFLDEIGEMPLNLQVKLLRVLQERQVSRVGATHDERVDIRVIAATHRDLDKAVQERQFREDLFYRLNVVMLALPPLRERGEDVVVIANYLLQKVCKDFGMPARHLGADAVVAIKRYAWPGNIRQLENRIKKAVVLSSHSALTPDDLDLPPEFLEAVTPLNEAKERFAHRYVLEVLERNGGNRTQTARELDVDPRTIFRYLEKDLS